MSRTKFSRLTTRTKHMADTRLSGARICLCNGKNSPRCVNMGIKASAYAAFIFTFPLSSENQRCFALAIVDIMVAISLIASFLFASAVIAAPSKSRLAARVQRRREGRQSQPLNKLPGNPLSPESSNSTHEEYSSNWAGAVWDSYPSVCGIYYLRQYSLK